MTASVVLGTLTAAAEQEGKIYRIGLLVTPPSQPCSVYRALFIAALRDLGYVEVLDDATLARLEPPETPAVQLRMTPAAVADALLAPTAAPVEPPAPATVGVTPPTQPGLAIELTAAPVEPPASATVAPPVEGGPSK